MRASALFRIATDPPARLWSGVGDLVIPHDSVENDESLPLYLGGGQLAQIPEIEQLINGTASRLSITVSGVAPDTQRLAQEDAPEVKGAAVDIGLVYFGDDLQISEVEWLAVLRADSLTVDSQDGEDGRTRLITLSVGSEFTDRSKAPIALFTDADQRRRSPTDAIFDHVAGISAGTSRPFGPRA